MLREKHIRYLDITRSNIGLILGPNALQALLLLMIAPILFGVNDLDYVETSMVLEQFVALLGIILLTPIFRAEQQKDIREVIESKFASQTGIYIVRIIMAILTTILFIFAFIELLKFNRCIFPLGDFLLGSICTSLFLGSMGLLFYAISNQIILGYMMPIGYYIFNLFTRSKYVKEFYLFSLAKGSMKEKYYLLGASIAMILATLLYKRIQRKVR